MKGSSVSFLVSCKKVAGNIVLYGTAVLTAWWAGKDVVEILDSWKLSEEALTQQRAMETLQMTEQEATFVKSNYPHLDEHSQRLIIYKARKAAFDIELAQRMKVFNDTHGAKGPKDSFFDSNDV